MSRLPLVLVACLLLAACATSRDTVILLPKDDGSTGAIAASRGGAEILLDSPYAQARSGGSRMRPGTASPAEVEKRFGAALSAMPPAPKSFVVYFQSGGDEFTPESVSTLEQMLADMKERPSPEITVIGHTDRVGSDADNDALSLQRAGKVREILVGMGVAPEHVNAAGRGSREPLVPTEAGVDEPRNRRVEVSVR